MEPLRATAGRRRIACVWLPRFGLAVAARNDRLRRAPEGSRPPEGSQAPAGPEGWARPEGPPPETALYRPGTRWQELLECSPDLEAAGIRPGFPLKEAQAVAPHNTYLPCDSATLAAISRAFAPVLDALDAFSPAVEPVPEAELGEGRAVAYLDVAGLERLYGPERQLGMALAEAAARAAGSPAVVGIASSKFIAWVAATTAPPTTAGGAAENAVQDGVVAVPEGEEGTFLDPLPLEALPLDLTARRALERLGVRTIGAFARLPANAVAHRYGPTGRLAHRLARGEDDAPLRPRRPRPAAAVALTFEWEETELDRLTFALKTLADQLAARLAALGAEDPASAADDDRGEDGEHGGEIDIADPWPDDGEVPAAWVQGPVASRGLGASGGSAAPGGPGAPGGAGAGPGKAAQQTSRYAAEALRVVWHLSDGETREALLRLAEPACSATVFTEHLRWHAEGLERLLAPAPPETPSPQQAAPPAAREAAESAGGAAGDADGDAGGGAGTLRYDPIERRRGVIGITLEAVGVQAPTGTQLKLLATPLHWWGSRGDPPGGAGPATVRLDPVTRAQYARRAVARLQARWGQGAVWRPALVPARLPERRVRDLPPALGLQLEGARGAARTPPLPPDEDVNAPLLAQAPLWLIDPPQRVRVVKTKRRGERRRLIGWPGAAGGMTAGMAAGMAGGNERNGTAQARRGRRIVHWGGPWRVVDVSALDTEGALRREYYQIETEDGAAYLVFLNPDTETWFLQGVFD